jgi:hypothetical protein
MNVIKDNTCLNHRRHLPDYSLFPLFSQDEIQGQLTGQDLPANRQWTVGIISAGTTVNLSFLYDYPVRGKINGKRTIRI